MHHMSQPIPPLWRIAVSSTAGAPQSKRWKKKFNFVAAISGRYFRVRFWWGLWRRSRLGLCWWEGFLGSILVVGGAVGLGYSGGWGFLGSSAVAAAAMIAQLFSGGGGGYGCSAMVVGCLGDPSWIHEIDLIEIDRYLRLVPLISLVHKFRMQFFFITATDLFGFCSSQTGQRHNYGGILEGEKEKLNIELQRSRTNKDVKQCQLIEHLIDVTENVVNELPGKNLKKLVVNEPAYVISGYVTNANSGIKTWKNRFNLSGKLIFSIVAKSLV
ncbi:hypothetical protein Q3G72_027706 [Acer saccharum]|nr:hypothetical protein Q3G72_027706 [Acer saccharum]